MPMTTSAPPNLWDMTEDAKQNRLKGVESIRPHYDLGGYGNNYAGYGKESRDIGAAGQQAALQMYADQASGNGPSVAEAQLRQQTEANNRAAMAMAARTRGGNLAGMQQQALAAGSGANAATNQAAAALRNQEQQQAMAAYADLSSRMYGQGLAYDQLASNQALQGDQNALGWYTGKRGLDLQKQASDRQFYGGLINSGIGMASSLLDVAGSMSDERVKDNIRPSEMSATQAVGAIEPVKYEYKPGYGKPGERIGLLAQDLEKTPAGSQLVTETPYGKAMDVGGVASLALAATAENQQREKDRDLRLDNIEKMLSMYGGEAA